MPEERAATSRRGGPRGVAVRLLAQTYHDSPEYREEWRPRVIPE
ncbi:DUF6221 family protein [Streptomyces fragilis]